jgi:hypothetical protein
MKIRHRLAAVPDLFLRAGRTAAFVLKGDSFTRERTNFSPVLAKFV